MRNIIIIIKKQLKDTLKNKTILIQFILFPLMTLIMENAITLDGMPELFFTKLFSITYDDKYYVGYYENKMLIAVMDLIAGYPDDSTIYIGLFMMKTLLQGKGIGTAIIQELCDYCKAQGYERIKLAWVKGNPQSERFWKKNNFIPIGECSSTAAEHVIAAERKL